MSKLMFALANIAKSNSIEFVSTAKCENCYRQQHCKNHINKTLQPLEFKRIVAIFISFFPLTKPIALNGLKSHKGQLVVIHHRLTIAIYNKNGE